MRTELTPSKIIDFENGAQAWAFVQRLVRAFMGARIEGINDVNNKRAWAGFDFFQPFRVTTAVSVFLMLQDHFRRCIPLRHTLE